MLLKPLLQWASPAGASGHLSVLIFHRVLSEPDPLFPEEMHARRFDALCGWLASWFNVLPLDEAVERLKAGRLPARAACLTFDDGYADNHHVALPILQRHLLKATFFIATRFLDGGRMWNDTIIESIRRCNMAVLDLSPLGLGRHALDSIANRRAAIASLIDQIKYRPLAERITLTEQLGHLAGVQSSHDLMMTSDEVKAMRHAGMQIGAHTMSHPILARLTDEQARQEIEGSKCFLEQLLGERVGLFAYPNGKPGDDYTPQSVDVVRSLGFDAAVSTHWGALAMGGDLYQIPRFTPWDSTKLRFGARLLANLRSA
ncbi:MAG: polysaccharide deacetylase family protein [Rhodoferax sp.]|uniref:polysaccharide deacetylase family protein n=1 Tax=Rhodoferax sp. TaxID=50421 RepID=UPI0017BC0B41|nr:polysaccharide deacetylase family protein [Rhodoferax sp.]NMM14073.1 polysaccharide deacetylase family protein [Rhodoferax sp.]NMM21349.1 polysaccharide deacetylase family protein [Rhodoferax sp.]